MSVNAIHIQENEIIASISEFTVAFAFSPEFFLISRREAEGGL